MYTVYYAVGFGMGMIRSDRFRGLTEMHLDTADGNVLFFIYILLPLLGAVGLVRDGSICAPTLLSIKICLLAVFLEMGLLSTSSVLNQVALSLSVALLALQGEPYAV